MKEQGATCLQIVFVKICPVRGHGIGARACSVLTAGACASADASTSPIPASWPMARGYHGREKATTQLDASRSTLSWISVGPGLVRIQCTLTSFATLASVHDSTSTYDGGVFRG